jgi:hypothetical protein
MGWDPEGNEEEAPGPPVNAGRSRFRAPRPALTADIAVNAGRRADLRP